MLFKPPSPHLWYLLRQHEQTMTMIHSCYQKNTLRCIGDWIPVNIAKTPHPFIHCFSEVLPTRGPDPHFLMPTFYTHTVTTWVSLNCPFFRESSSLTRRCRSPPPPPLFILIFLGCFLGIHHINIPCICVALKNQCLIPL